MLLMLASLLSCDYLLKAEYASGKYKDPHDSYTQLNFKDFDTVDLISSTAVNIKFVQGPFKVSIAAGARNYARIKQQGNRLQIDAIFEGNYYRDPRLYVLLISCPKLEMFAANATYRANNRQVTDSIVREDWNMRQVLIEGFDQDSLNINQDYGSTVVLMNNHIRSVNVIAGKSPGSGSKTIMLKGNQFQHASLDIRNESKLVLYDTGIHHLDYHLADSAELVLNGATQKTLKQ